LAASNVVSDRAQEANKIATQQKRRMRLRIGLGFSTCESNLPLWQTQIFYCRLLQGKSTYALLKRA
jgi:hypothetical protein